MCVHWIKGGLVHIVSMIAMSVHFLKKSISIYVDLRFRKHVLRGEKFQS